MQDVEMVKAHQKSAFFVTKSRPRTEKSVRSKLEKTHDYKYNDIRKYILASLASYTLQLRLMNHSC
ncbi:unnamed protein product [Onchocerca flexuosa]|uniref:Transposase n=1 Tax=Onchocerca flexuosa TaxID=387005 RepID=A0A183HLZ1_9BILA|nr:unnamed protein product [Onchocerca flexuosa]